MILRRLGFRLATRKLRSCNEVAEPSNHDGATFLEQAGILTWIATVAKVFKWISLSAQACLPEAAGCGMA
jgi:hypothetical protein